MRELFVGFVYFWKASFAKEIEVELKLICWTCETVILLVKRHFSNVNNA